MQVNTLSAAQGIDWLRQGWTLFKRQPLGLPAMTVVYLFLRYAPLLVPLIGVAIAGFLAPFAVVGMMTACREAAAGRSPMPAAFARAFSDRAGQRALVRLGLFHMGVSVGVALFTAAFMPDFGDKVPTMPELIDSIPVWLLAVVFLAEVLMLMLMWFAPLFASWHGQPAGKALFFSFAAVARNKWAFLLFGATVMLIAVLAIQLLATLLAALSAREAAGLLIAPFVLVVIAIVQCAAYASYTAIVRSAARAV
jgi:hypothetical protein